MLTTEHREIKKRPINVTIREDLVDEAKMLKLNASKAAEYGILLAIKAEKEKRWLEENKDAISAHNDRIEREGTLLKPIWLD